jgi:hypothetical protein
LGKAVSEEKIFRNQPIACGGHVCLTNNYRYIYIVFTTGLHFMPNILP